MVETPEAIRVEIDQRREAISRDVDTIEERARSLTDWRQHVESRPLTMVALAFGGGALLGTLLTSSSSSDSDDSERYQPQGLWEASSVTHDGAQRSSTSEEKPRKRASRDSGLSDRIDVMRGALMALAVTKGEEYLRDLLPGFADEEKKVQQKRGFQGSTYGATTSSSPPPATMNTDPWHERPSNTHPVSHVGEPASRNPAQT